MQYYNIHSHVFTMKNAPEKFLNLYLPDSVANLVDKITNTQAGARHLASLLSLLPSNVAKRYASFLRIGKSAEQIDVFRTLREQYKGSAFKFIALAMYMEDCGALGSQSGYEGQLEELLNIKQQYPDELLLFLGVDPRWKHSGAELRKTIENKFNYRLATSAARSVFPYVGLKLYPSTGFYAFDENLQETFEWAADNGVPVLSHCNYLGGIYNNDKTYLQRHLNPQDPYTGALYGIPQYQKKFKPLNWLMGTNTARNNKFTCSYFLEPASFTTMAKHFHTNRKLSAANTGDNWFNAYRQSLNNITDDQRLPLKICLAHYGGDDQILMENNAATYESAVGIKPKNWCGQIKDLMTEFNGIYTDISYALANKKINPFLIKDLENPTLGDRILFGTDFFLTERESPEKEVYTNFRKTMEAYAMTRLPDHTAWDVIASRNTEKFLHSKYYDGKVI